MVILSKFQNKYRIESARLKDWDYSSPSWYYVTINTKNKIHWFGKVRDTEIIINNHGKVVKQCWFEIPSHYKAVELDDFIIMPNHVHGIIIINNNPPTVKTPYMASLQPTLGDIVGKFKGAVTREIRKKGENKFSWQARFYDRIIRDNNELQNIRNYIKNNPLNWEIYGELYDDFEKLFGKKKDA